MYLLNLEIETQIHLQTFFRNLRHKRRKAVKFFYIQVKQVSEEKVESSIYKIQNKLYLLASVLHYFLYFCVVFTKRTPELAENKQNTICCHEGII